MIGKHAFRRCDRHQTCSRSKRCLARHGGRSVFPREPPIIEHLAVSSLIAVGNTRRQFVRLDQVEGMVFILEKLYGVSDIRKDHVSRFLAVWIQNQRWLQCRESHGERACRPGEGTSTATAAARGKSSAILSMTALYKPWTGFRTPVPKNRVDDNVGVHQLEFLLVPIMLIQNNRWRVAKGFEDLEVRSWRRLSPPPQKQRETQMENSLFGSAAGRQQSRRRRCFPFRTIWRW